MSPSSNGSSLQAGAATTRPVLLVTSWIWGSQSLASGAKPTNYWYANSKLNRTFIVALFNLLKVHRVDVFAWSRDAFSKCDKCQLSYRGLLLSPFEFSWRNRDICISPCGDPGDFLLNIQRSIISAFLTVPTVHHATRRWRRMEEVHFRLGFPKFLLHLVNILLGGYTWTLYDRHDGVSRRSR